MRQKIAKQYAGGLFELAQELDAIDIIHDDLMAAVSISDEHPEIRHFLNQPRIPTAKKKALVDELAQVVQKSVNPDVTENRHVVQDFLKLLSS